VRIGTKTDLNLTDCGVCKLPFCHHRAIELTQDCFALPFHVSISLFRLPSLVKTTPRYSSFSTCCSVLPLLCCRHWLGFLERHITSAFSEKWRLYKVCCALSLNLPVEIWFHDLAMISIWTYPHFSNNKAGFICSLSKSRDSRSKGTSRN